jgi:predicted nucleic acid-binding protein
MRIVVDTNIAFSAILNTNSKIASIPLYPKSKFNFYSTEQLLKEIEDHKAKIKQFTDYTDHDLKRIIELITGRIRFINVRLISKESYQRAEFLVREIDEDDTEFIALTEHIKGKFWSGDNELQRGLMKKDWKKFITTDELFEKQK